MMLALRPEGVEAKVNLPEAEQDWVTSEIYPVMMGRVNMSSEQKFWGRVGTM